MRKEGKLGLRPGLPLRLRAAVWGWVSQTKAAVRDIGVSCCSWGWVRLASVSTPTTDLAIGTVP